VTAPPREPASALRTRVIRRDTPLAGAVIVHPAGKDWCKLAARLAAAIRRQSGAKPTCHEDTALLPTRATPLPGELRTKPLVFIGNLATNRALPPLYANYLCSTDATYPGGDGHDLRVIVNPYGTGANVVLAGGSSTLGVSTAVERLIMQLEALPKKAPLPWVLDVDVAPALAAQLAAWPYTPLDDSAALQALRSRGLMFYTEPIRVIGSYTLMWAWTADARYAAIAVEALRNLNASLTNGYGDWHYLAERFLRAIPLLIAGGFLNDEDIRRTDELLLLTAYGNESEWWRMRHGEPPFGHRHQGKGTYEFLLLARYLRDQCDPTPELRAECERWIGECRAFLDGLAAAGLDDQDDESSLNNLATLYRYALGEERHAFFTSGLARLVAQRAIALHDNNGNGAGQGGYGESQGMYLQQEATEQTACCAFYYGDAELKWILQALPNLEISQRYVFLRYVPVFLQKYDTGETLAAVKPLAGRNVTCLPVTDHQFRISNHPPVHIEPQGHMVNAPETWELPEAIGLNRLPQARGFDKIALRGGFARTDAYLLLQGYQGGFRWQGHMQAANCIVRFFQAGHVWLVQNTSRHSMHDKNGLLISDGANDTPMPPIAERIAVADFPATALTVTRLSDYHHTDWTRHLFWSKAGGGCFVCLDHVAFQRSGPFSVTCTWRTPGHAALAGRTWRSDQGNHRFTLTAGRDLAATVEIDTDQGACSPYCLRQREAGEFTAGDELVFPNLFAVRPLDNAPPTLHTLTPRTFIVRAGDATVAWGAIRMEANSPWIPGGTLHAASAWIEAGSLTLAHATQLKFTAEDCGIESDRPVQIHIDLQSGALFVQCEAPARIALACGEARSNVVVEGELALPLPVDRCGDISRAVSGWLARLQPVAAVAPPPAPATPAWTPRREWQFDPGTRRAEVIRAVRVTADPLPINGSPDELLDPVMPDGYSRETWIQWPVAEAYELTLTLPAPRALTALHLLGDCPDDPTLRTFNPLPDGIIVTAQAPDGSEKKFALHPGPDRPYKRYRDAENRLHVRTTDLAGKVFAKLRVHIPAPPAGRPFVLHRLEVCGDAPVIPAVERWIHVDLDGDCRSELIFANASHELIVLGFDGAERWRVQFPTNVTHLSAQPLDPSGPPVLCVGLLGGDFILFAPDGGERAHWTVAQSMHKRRDCLQGWFNSAHSAAIWKRDEQGRGWLVLGGYAILVFLNAEGEIVGHSFSDGPWNYNVLVSPVGRPDAGDIYVRCGWNHGIMWYPHVPGDGPSGEVYHLGGFNQPMFRMLKRVIPFLNGRSLAAAWIPPADERDGALFFATELGCGVLSAKSKTWIWKAEGGMSLNACSLGQIDGRPVALTGGADGFVIAIDLADGRAVRRQHVGGPVISVHQTTAGGIIAGTRRAIVRLDSQWSLAGTAGVHCREVLSLGDRHLLVARSDHTLELLDFTDSSSSRA
jgi:hypothetical protein